MSASDLEEGILRSTARSSSEAEPAPPATDSDVTVFPPPSPILDHPIIEKLFLTQSWDDPSLDMEALRVGPGKTVLAVTGGGCTVLSLALLGPARILSVDSNAAQNHLLHLKIAGAKTLSHPEYLELLGALPSTRRNALYLRCRSSLPSRAGSFWDQQISWIRRGLLGRGRHERLLTMIRVLLLLIEGQGRIRRLFEVMDSEERERFYEREWDGSLWRLLLRSIFSRTVFRAAGISGSFASAEEDEKLGRHFLELARHALVDLSPRGNYLLARVCLGRYLDERAMPLYLRAENFAALKAAVDRIEVVTDGVGAVLLGLPSRSVDAFAYSNVFEWAPPGVFESLLRQTHRVGRPGARLCYRSLLVHRRHPRALNGLLQPEEALAARLRREDRSFVYSHFEVATVLKPGRSTGAEPLS